MSPPVCLLPLSSKFNDSRQVKNSLGNLFHNQFNVVFLNLNVKGCRHFFSSGSRLIKRDKVIIIKRRTVFLVQLLITLTSDQHAGSW